MTEISGMNVIVLTQQYEGIENIKNPHNDFNI